VPGDFGGNGPLFDCLFQPPDLQLLANVMLSPFRGAAFSHAFVTIVIRRLTFAMAQS
jgi:hypothetical protein